MIHPMHRRILTAGSSTATTTITICQEFPFINFAARRINVSAEVVGYSPVSLRELAARIREGLQQEAGYVVHLRYPYIR